MLPLIKQIKARPNQRDIIKVYCPSKNFERKLVYCLWGPECICTKTPPGG